MKEFRIYDKEEKCYLEEPDFRWMLSRKGMLYNSENDEWHTIGERFIVEFFIGLTDKNGVKIFEGDKLFHSNHNVESVSTWLPKYVTFAGIEVTTGISFYYQSIDEKYLTVIGNIHKN